MSIFNYAIRDPANPTSFRHYSLVLDEAATTYTMTVQGLADNADQHDWRAEYTIVSGRYERCGDAFTFHVEQGSTANCCTGWPGRGREEWIPFASFTGTLAGDTFTVDYFAELTLERGERAYATPTLIVPDYEFA